MAIWSCEGKVLANVGITSTDTMYFASQGAREGWMSDKAKFTFTEYSPIREPPNSKNGWNVGCAHIAAKIGEVEDCDYIMYKNTNVSSRWMYGQITYREYVNPNSTRIYFNLDFYSTYSDIIEFGKCFVARHHSHPDFESGDYYQQDDLGLYAEPLQASIGVRTVGIDPIGTLNSAIRPGDYFVMANTNGLGFAPGNTQVFQSPYYPGDFLLGNFFAQVPTLTSLIALLDDYKQNMLTNISSFIAGQGLQDPLTFDVSQAASVELITRFPSQPLGITTVKRPKKSDFAVTINNLKTVSSLYCYKTVESIQGDRMILDDFDYNNGEEVTIYSTATGLPIMQPQIYLERQGYRTKSFYLPPYPTYSFDSNGAADWAINNWGLQTGRLLSNTTKIVGGGVMYAGSQGSAGSGEVVAGISGITEQIGETLQGITQLGNTVGQTTNTAFWAGTQFQLMINMNAPCDADIVAVDSFFTMNGYQVNQYMKPDPSLRPKVVYIQTVGCTLLGASATYPGNEQLRAQMDSGLRFWNMSGLSHIGDDVGSNL